MTALKDEAARVLVVNEGDSSAVSAVAELLSKAGFIVQTAESDEAALAFTMGTKASFPNPPAITSEHTPTIPKVVVVARHPPHEEEDAKGLIPLRVPGATMAQIEREAILRTLEGCGGSTTRAAELLGISVRTIQYRLHEYGLARPSSAHQHQHEQDKPSSTKRSSSSSASSSASSSSNEPLRTAS